MFLYVFIWVRATLPRYRYDQLMRLGWKVLIPLAIANLVVTGIVKVLLAGNGLEADRVLLPRGVHPRVRRAGRHARRNTVHSVLFLVLDFLFVAALYVLLGAQFLAVIQILVYAGGIVVLYLFVVMLVNLKRPPEAPSIRTASRSSGFALAAAVLAELGGDPGVSAAARPRAAAAAARSDAGDGNTEHGRLAALHRLPDSVRDRVDAAAGRDDRRHRAGEGREL